MDFHIVGFRQPEDSQENKNKKSNGNQEHVNVFLRRRDEGYLAYCDSKPPKAGWKGRSNIENTYRKKLHHVVIEAAPSKNKSKLCKGYEHHLDNSF